LRRLADGYTNSRGKLINPKVVIGTHLILGERRQATAKTMACMAEVRSSAATRGYLTQQRIPIVVGRVISPEWKGALI
jgi:hypothetical protein